MTDINQQINAYQATKKLALELINSDSLKKQTSILLDELLPPLAADIENDLHEKGARLLYTLKVQRHKPIVHILLKTRNHLHERLIFFDSKNQMFILNDELERFSSNNAMNITLILKNILINIKDH
ncbi:hypothetical protein LMORI2_09150 [Limnohabitans sp. MORI2]|uniref:hypothetical protein n=1 Tax=Limnohabitans sp. MORI2 TaxID=1751150 RepID=UPI0023770E91|nr:hypothetical protein [Limnohabitans sp. MORI2]BDU57933.1 hypothetical protein LMORI2_09150 [Limnohabitans sp. MORI2]